MSGMILLQNTAWLPEAASSIAPEVDSLFHFWTLVSAIIFVGVVGAMTFFVVRYRRRRRDEVPEPVQEKKVVELAWIVVPTILVLIVFAWGFRVYIKMYTAPPDAYEILVHGYQWYWEFEYPNGVKTTNELHVPAGQPVKLRMTSADVIHSFYVPAFRVKQDVLPDRYSALWFEATKPGEYTVFCTEYCGTQHSGMLAKVIVHPREEFEQWLESAGIPEDMPLAELAPGFIGRRPASAATASTDRAPWGLLSRDFTDTRWNLKMAPRSLRTRITSGNPFCNPELKL